MKTKITSLALLLIIFTVVSCKKDKVSSVDDDCDETNISTAAILNHGLGAIETPEYIYKSLPVYMPDENYYRGTKPATYIQKHPPVGDQGASQTCGGWAIGYAGRSIAYRASHPSSSWGNGINVFSPAYVYNSLNNGSCNVGLTAPAVFNLFQNDGICTWSKKPFVAGQCTPAPNSQMNNNAANYKIAANSWGTIPFPGNSSTLTQTINAIKTNLVAGNAVVVLLKIEHYYDHLGKGKILKKFNAASVRGNHFNTIIGYNQSKRYFILQNSWGTDWATNGLAYVSYDMITSGAWMELYYMNKQ